MFIRVGLLRKITQQDASGNVFDLRRYMNMIIQEDLLKNYTGADQIRNFLSDNIPMMIAEFVLRKKVIMHHMIIGYYLNTNMNFIKFF